MNRVKPMSHGSFKPSLTLYPAHALLVVLVNLICQTIKWHQIIIKGKTVNLFTTKNRLNSLLIEA
jgi:hypothetical protein